MSSSSAGRWTSAVGSWGSRVGALLGAPSLRGKELEAGIFHCKSLYQPKPAWDLNRNIRYRHNVKISGGLFWSH